MSELKILTESFPERCEVCHQIDCFDAKRNYCSRCSPLSDLIVNPNENDDLIVDRIRPWRALTGILLLLTSILAGAIIGGTGTDGPILGAVFGSILGILLGTILTLVVVATKMRVIIP